MNDARFFPDLWTMTLMFFWSYWPRGLVATIFKMALMSRVQKKLKLTPWGARPIMAGDVHFADDTMGQSVETLSAGRRCLHATKYCPRKLI